MAKIMVVDDSATLRHMVVHVLREAGHEISQAESAEQALSRIESFGPELVLTDLYMGGLDGIELAREIRTIPGYRDTPILVLSTDSSLAVKQRGKANGVNGWIAKPFDPEILQGVVQKVLH